MPTVASNNHRIASRVLPNRILFEEEDGIYWLRGPDLEHASKLLRLRFDGHALGFDYVNWSVCAQELASKHVDVGLIQGNVVHVLDFQRPKHIGYLHGRSVELDPRQLFGRAELERLEHVLNGKRSRRGLPLLDDDGAVANACSVPLADFGTVYVYEVSDEIYEVDWDLTSVPSGAVQAFAVAAQLTGQKLPCQLVPPRPKRGNTRVRPQPEPIVRVAEPIPFGQLGLSL